MLTRRERSKLLQAIGDTLPNATLEEVLRSLRAELGAPAPDYEPYRAIFEAAAMGIAVVDAQGRVERANPALSRFLGHSAHDLSGMTFTAFTHPEDRELDWTLYTELVEGKRSHYQIDKRYLHRSGRIVFGHLTVSLLQGLPRRALGMVEDRTERQAQTREQKRLTRALAERTKELSVIHDVACLTSGPTTNLEGLLRAVAQRLPAAVQYTERAAARVRYGGMEFTSPGYSPAACCTEVRRHLADGSQLTLEVVYPCFDEVDPARAFTAEEIMTLEAIAELLGSAIGRSLAEARLERLRAAARAGNTELALGVRAPHGGVRAPHDAFGVRAPHDALGVRAANDARATEPPPSASNALENA